MEKRAKKKEQLFMHSLSKHSLSKGQIFSVVDAYLRPGNTQFFQLDFSGNEYRDLVPPGGSRKKKTHQRSLSNSQEVQQKKLPFQEPIAPATSLPKSRLVQYEKDMKRDSAKKRKNLAHLGVILGVQAKKSKARKSKRLSNHFTDESNISIKNNVSLPPIKTEDHSMLSALENQSNDSRSSPFTKQNRRMVQGSPSQLLRKIRQKSKIDRASYSPFSMKTQSRMGKQKRSDLYTPNLIPYPPLLKENYSPKPIPKEQIKRKFMIHRVDAPPPPSAQVSKADLAIVKKKVNTAFSKQRMSTSNSHRGSQVASISVDKGTLQMYSRQPFIERYQSKPSKRRNTKREEAQRLANQLRVPIMPRPVKKPQQIRPTGDPLIILHRKAGAKQYEIRLYLIKQRETLAAEIFSIKKQKVIDRDKLQFSQLEDLIGQGLEQEEERLKDQIVNKLSDCLKVIKGKLVVRAVHDQVPAQIDILHTQQSEEGAQRVNKIIQELKKKNKKRFTKFIRSLTLVQQKIRRSSIRQIDNLRQMRAQRPTLLAKGVVKLGQKFYRFQIFGSMEQSYEENLEFDFYDIQGRKSDTKAKRVKMDDIKTFLQKSSRSPQQLGMEFVRKLKPYSGYLEFRTVDELIDTALEVSQE